MLYFTKINKFGNAVNFLVFYLSFISMLHKVFLCIIVTCDQTVYNSWANIYIPIFMTAEICDFSTHYPTDHKTQFFTLLIISKGYL